jgi:hypothetical protein
MTAIVRNTKIDFHTKISPKKEEFVQIHKQSFKELVYKSQGFVEPSLRFAASSMSHIAPSHKWVSSPFFIYSTQFQLHFSMARRNLNHFSMTRQNFN